MASCLDRSHKRSLEAGADTRWATSSPSVYPHLISAQRLRSMQCGFHRRIGLGPTQRLTTLHLKYCYVQLISTFPRPDGPIHFNLSQYSPRCSCRKATLIFHLLTFAPTSSTTLRMTSINRYGHSTTRESFLMVSRSTSILKTPANLFPTANRYQMFGS